MKRYLLYISYIGSHFKGVQKQPPTHPLGAGIPTVQGVLEEALRKQLRLINEVNVVNSSRTDAGVHAIKSAVHVDLQGLQLDRSIDPLRVTAVLNRYFSRESIGLRVQQTRFVPDSFHARFSAVSRSYLYRLAVRNSSVERPTSKLARSKLTIGEPITEHDRTFFVKRPEFDASIAQQALALLPGTRDFSTFVGKLTHLPPEKSTVVTLHSAELFPAKPFLPHLDPEAELYSYWEFKFVGRSFLYRQVRRMVSVVLAAAQEKISLDDVRLMLEQPGSESWKERVGLVPAHGLYLLEVSYNDTDLLEEEPQHETTDNSSLKYQRNERLDPMKITKSSDDPRS